MELLSTVALLASLSLPATAIPNWSSDKTKKHERLVTSIISKELYCENTIKGSTIADFTIPHNEEIPVINTASDVFSQLDGYSELEPGWDGPDSVTPSSIDIKLAIDFVASIPAIFPLPKAMVSSDGTIGLYWDDTFMYIDIQFESDHTLSMFSRDRSTGKERFIDSIDVATVNSSWFFDTLGELLSPVGNTLSA
ncbi:hypothetical protein [Nitrosomonas sp. Is37]|uniref:hypothetical protein n=1 Tax=Nitrosomonas sp. Is37 TaxID=3080535 RepID=UPI00294AA6A4|nr:hypothetical protein [Nitrosomonas sp. Is37]MDV6345086.1 hypothetical protein [Nitrosomonas sp. Is37]